MKKIGIVTYVKTATCNYGAELQSFALQHKLNEIGYDAEVLDLHRDIPSNSKFNETVIKAIKNRFERMPFFSAMTAIFNLFLSVLTDKYYNRKYAIKIKQKKDMFARFFMENIRHSPKEYYPHELDKAHLPYDIYIAGSDQIWNYKNSDRVDVFFLMFANRFNSKKISYAASFSVSEIPNEYRERYAEWINNIDYLSVRESDGIKICLELTGRTPVHVCDPTLLLGRNEWEHFCVESQCGFPLRKYVVIYSMSRSHSVIRIAKDISHKLGDIDIVNIKLNFTPKKNDGVIHLDFVSPKQWVWLLLNAEYVVTDSFHGTAFSINFNKPFTVIQNPMSDLNSRVNTILNKTGLMNRIYLDDGESQYQTELYIDYTPINVIIDEWRKDSLTFLESSIQAK